MKKILGVILAAVMALGVVAGTAGATIGPFGGCYLDAYHPYKPNADSIAASIGVYGDGGNQTVNARLMVLVGSSWTQHGSTQSISVGSGFQNFVRNFPYACETYGASYYWRTEVKWQSYTWSQADKSPATWLAC